MAMESLHREVLASELVISPFADQHEAVTRIYEHKPRESLALPVPGWRKAV